MSRLDIPVALRNEISRLQIDEIRSAGATFLVDDSWRRKTVGMVSGTTREQAQLLLSPLYYVSRSLEPFTELRFAPADTSDTGIRQLIDEGLSALILADVGQLQQLDYQAIETWVENGGTLIRFAGPRLATRQDQLIPVPLRSGGRALGGALSWSEPQTLSPFDENGLFEGLQITDENHGHAASIG